MALRRGTGPPFQSLSSCRKRVDFALGGFREVVPRARGRLCVGVGLCVGVRELTYLKEELAYLEEELTYLKEELPYLKE